MAAIWKRRRGLTQPSISQLKSQLVGIIADGFNRSISALEENGAIDCDRLREHYQGIGSKYYDVVTKQIELTAEYAATSLHRMFCSEEDQNGGADVEGV